MDRKQTVSEQDFNYNEGICPACNHYNAMLADKYSQKVRTLKCRDCGYIIEVISD